MPTSYFLNATDSDLTGGADFTKLLDDAAAARSTLAFTVANETTETSHGVTDVGVPGADGGSGTATWTVKVDVDVGSTSIFCSVRVSRINAAGSQQAISSATAEQQCTAGVKTFTLSLVNLGTWAAGDRLRVLYLFRSSNAHGGAAGITIGLNTADSEVTAPWTISGPQTITPSGTITPTGALAKQAQKLLAGQITPTGALAKQTQKPLGGGFTPSGSHTKQAQKSLAGAVAPSGGLSLTIPLAQLTDDFEDASLGTQWEEIAGTVTEASGLLELDNATTYAVVHSRTFVDATEAEMLGEWTFYTGVDTGSAQSGFKLFRGAGATYGHVQIMRHGAGSIQISKTEDNVSIFAESITYSATNHKWLRIRFTATQVIFEASADGTDWTQPWTNSVSALPTWSLTDGVKVELFAGFFNAGQPDPGTTFLDNFNLAPAGGAITPSGTITPTGTLAKVVQQSLSGSIAPGGEVAKQLAQAPLGGSIEPAGAIAKQAQPVFVGSIEPTGIFSSVKVALIFLAGEIAPTGALLRAAAHLLGGNITPAGDLAPAAAYNRAFDGTTAPTGALTRDTSQVLTGSIEPTGIVASTKVALISLAGAIVPTGVLLRTAGKLLGGNLTPTSEVSKDVTISRSGTTAPTGSVQRSATYARSFAGETTPTGTLSTLRALLINLGGAITPVGTLVRQAQKVVGGTITPVRTLSKNVALLRTGSTSPTGALLKLVSRVLGGSVTPTGSTTVQNVGELAKGVVTASGVYSDTVTASGTYSDTITALGSI